MESKQKRLAKNTMLLYMRTLVTMCISLYTSRVILDELGVDDYGIYNVVGGMVSMCSVITSTLTTAINRYMSYELGRDDMPRLMKVFSTSVSIQLLLSLIIIVIGETVGYWFLNYKMVIPGDRMFAANCVLHCSLLSFVIGLVSVPYNAAIVAHERMDAFAYISILDAFMRLGIVLILAYIPYDNLVTYAILLVAVSTIIRLIYGIYCKRKFAECHYRFILDRNLFKEMFHFAGWNFFSTAFYVFNTQGVNMLINVYFGVAVNAARGIATQVESAVMTFVKNFITAINPQIIKAYAAGDKAYLTKLVVYGAKYTYFMSLMFVVPFVLETDYVMGLWLKDVPDNAVLFVRLSFLYGIIDSVGNTCYYACVANGNMKYYTLRLTTVGCLIFPLTWVALKHGAAAESVYIVSGSVAFICMFLRLFVLRKLTSFKPMDFIKGMILPSLLTTVPVFTIPFLVRSGMDEGIIRLVAVIMSSEAALFVCAMTLGMTATERLMVTSHISKYISRFSRERLREDTK